MQMFWKLSISSAFNPAIAELIKVSEFPDDKSSAEISTISSNTNPSTTHNG